MKKLWMIIWNNDHKVLNFVLFGCLVIQVSIALWGLNKGFDPWDESVSLLAILPEQEGYLYSSYWWVFVRKILFFLQPNIITIRLLRFVLTSFSAIFFAYGYWKWFRSRIDFQGFYWSPYIVFLILYIGSLLDYANGLQTYSKNHMNGNIILITAGALLYLLSKRKIKYDSKLKWDLIWVFIGFLIGVQAFVKTPSAMANGALIVIVIISVFWNKNILWKIRYLVILGLGVFLGILFSVFLTGLDLSWLDYFNTYLSVVSGSTHNTLFILFYAFQEAIKVGSYIFTYYFTLLVGIFLLLRYSMITRAGHARDARVIWGSFGALLLFFLIRTTQTMQFTPYATFTISNLIIVVIVLLALRWETIRFPELSEVKYSFSGLRILLSVLSVIIFPIILKILLTESAPFVHTVHKVIFSLLPSLILIIVIVFFDNLKDLFFKLTSNNSNVVFLYLLILPIAGANGTNTGNIEKSIYQISPWFAMLIILLALLWKMIVSVKTPYRQWVIVITLAFIVITANFQTIYGYILHPYHLTGTLFNQTEEARSIKRLKGIKLDPETKAFYEDMYKMIVSNSDFQANDPIIAFYNVPGFVYALGGLSPGPLTFDRSYNSEQICSLLSKTRMENLDRAIIITNSGFPNGFFVCLHTLGGRQESEYLYLGDINASYQYLVDRNRNVFKVYTPPR